MDALSFPHPSERKLVTIVFADLVGATQLGESLDVEQLRDVFDLFYQAVADEVEDCGGSVGQFVGDAVMALFGVPVTHEDDADRALGASLGVLERLRELNATLESSYGVRLDVRVGVNTGELVVPLEDAPDLGTVTGDAVNIAARLQAAAKPGSVLATERTVRASRRHRFEDRGEIELRGRHKPVHAYELVSKARLSRYGSLYLRSPLIGRTKELYRLHGALQDVASTSMPQIVTITGPAGVGKTRLVEEFVAAVADDAQVFEGSCLPFGEEFPYRPLAESLQAQGAIAEGNGLGVNLEKVLEAAPSGGPQKESARLASILAHTIGVATSEDSLSGLTPMQIGAAITDAWTNFYGGLSGVASVLVVIEDLQWADSALTDLLDHLGRTVVGPVMFLTTSRPELLSGLPTWGRGDHHQLIGLEPLDDPDAALLLRGLLRTEEISAQFERQVLEGTEGNPFFIEEVLGQLIDEGRIRRSQRGWILPTDERTLEIPDTIQAVLAARIDTLNASERRVLRYAAVIGRSFWAAGVAYLLEMAASEVLVILQRLEEKELVRPTSRLREGMEGAFAFKHVLTREVAYAGLPRRSRSRAHGRAFEWIEGMQSAKPREVLDLLAYHATQSYRAGSLDPTTESAREALRVRAFETLLAAAAAARATVALEKARNLATQALELASDDTEEARVQRDLGETAFFAYAGDDAWYHLKCAIDLMLETDQTDRGEIARLCARALETPVRWPGTMLAPPPEDEVHRYLTVGFDHTEPGGSPEKARLLMLESFWQHAYPDTDRSSPKVSPDESLAAGEAAAAMAHELEQPALESAALDGVAANWIPQGRYDRALEATKRRIRLLPSIADSWELGDIHAMGGWVNYHIGRYRDVLRYSDAGFAMTIDKIPSVALHCLTWRALARYKLGDWNGLIDDVAKGTDILEERTPPHFASPMIAAAAVVYELRGDTQAADGILSQLVRIDAENDESDRDVTPLARWAEFLALLLAHRGRFDEADRLASETTWRRGTRRGLLLQARCRVALESCAWDRAERVASEAEYEAKECGLEALAAEAHLLRGRAASVSSDSEGALIHLRLAIEGFRELGAVWDEARARQALAACLIDLGRSLDAIPHVDLASTTLTDLGIVVSDPLTEEVRAQPRG